MAHRQLLTDEERQALPGIPLDADSMGRCFTLSRADRHLVAARRRDANRIGFAVRSPCSSAPDKLDYHVEGRPGSLCG